MQKKSASELCQILRTVTIEIVINSTHAYEHMRVTISRRYALSLVLERCFSFLVLFHSCALDLAVYFSASDWSDIKLAEVLF